MGVSPEVVIRKWLGLKYQESPELGYQCVAWAKKFAEEIGYPIKGFSGSALKGWQTGSPFIGTRWVRCENKSYNYPKEGDLVFLSATKSNKYGHIGVVGKGSNDREIVIIEQNALTGNGLGTGGDVITERRIKYQSSRGNVLGWYTLTPEDSGLVASDFGALAKDAGIWNGENPNDEPSRGEAATMFIRASGKKVNDIWNSQNGEDKATKEEIEIMAKRAFPNSNINPLAKTRKQIAIWCFHQKSKK